MTVTIRHRYLDVPVLPILVALALASAVACATLQRQPTGDAVQDTRAKAIEIATAIERVGHAAEALQQMEISIHNTTDWIADTEHQRVQQGFLTFAQVTRGAITRARQATTDPELTATIQAVTGGLADLSAALALQHPQAAAVLQSAIAVLNTAMSILLQFA